jgi:hypothetical protein
LIVICLLATPSLEASAYAGANIPFSLVWLLNQTLVIMAKAFLALGIAALAFLRD